MTEYQGQVQYFCIRDDQFDASRHTLLQQILVVEEIVASWGGAKGGGGADRPE